MKPWKENYAEILDHPSVRHIMPDEDIENFIERFFARSPHPKECRDLFLHGNCYWFAVILHERFRNRLAEIWYDAINNHFYVCVRGVLYDANGAFIPEKQLTIDEYDAFKPWEEYRHFDRVHALRIIEQCINFIGD